MAARAPAPVDHYSSSDEAPEEESFSQSTAKVLERVKAQKQAVRESNKVQKEKRRARDTQLKSQKRKLLSEVLEDLKNEPKDFEEVAEVAVLKAPQVVVKAGQHKKLSDEKDGFEVKVVRKQKKSLPPPKSSLLDRKERFLFRSSVPRK